MTLHIQWGRAQRGSFRGDWWIGLALAVIAVAFRLYAVRHVYVYQLYGDMFHYDQTATTLLSRHYFSFWGVTPDAYVTPGYPLFLAACYKVASWISPHHQFALRMTSGVQAVLSGTVTAILYQLGRRVLGVPFAVAAAALWALYPPAIWSVTLILTETLFVFFLFLYLWTLVTAMDKQTLVWWSISGLTLGVAALVRPTVLPLVLLPAGMLAWQWWRGGSPMRQIAAAIFVHVAAFLTPLVPWWARNWILLHQFVATDTEVGNPLLFGSDPKFLSHPLLGRGLTEPQQKHLAIERIIAGFTHHPIMFSRWYTIGKLQYLFSKPWFRPLTGHEPTFFVLWLNVHIVWVVLGALGLFLGLFVREMRLFAGLALYLVLIQLPFIPVDRYAFPIMPFFFLGVGFLIQWTLHQSVWRPGWRKRGVIA